MYSLLVIPPYQKTNTVRCSELTRQHPADMRYSSPTIAGVSTGLALNRAGGRAMYKLVRASRLYEQIVAQIEESIVKGDLKPGDQLPAERDLAQRFGLNRAAEKKALARVIFRLVREQASQEAIESAAFAEGERQGLSRDEVRNVALWACQEAISRRAA